MSCRMLLKTCVKFSFKFISFKQCWETFEIKNLKDSINPSWNTSCSKLLQTITRNLFEYKFQTLRQQQTSFCRFVVLRSCVKWKAGLILSPAPLCKTTKARHEACVDGFTFIIRRKIALIPSTTVNCNEIIVAIIFHFSSLRRFH